MSITDRNNLGFDYESPAYRFGSLETQANNSLCVPIVYGKARAAGNKIWQSSGSDTFNALVCFSEGSITGFSDTRINDILITDKALSGCTYTSYLGNGTQTIDSRVPGSTQTDKAVLVGGLKYTAYLALTIKTSNKVANNYMDVSAVLQGKAVRVYTDTSTYTTIYSNNPAWCILDFLTCYNGCGLSFNDIDIQSFIDAAAYCDEKINPVNATGTVKTTSGSATVTGSGTKFLTEVKVGDQITVNQVNKIITAVSSNTSLTVDSNFSSTLSGQTMVVKDTRFTLNLILDTRKTRQDWLNEMLICCRGFLVYNGNKALIVIEQDKDTVQSFVENDIIADSEVFWTTPKEQRSDIFKIRYMDPNNQYARAYAVAEADTFLNSPPIVQEIVALGVTSFKQASRLAWFYLNQANTCDKFFSFTTTKKALDRTSGDLIDLTSTFLGYQNKKMVIVSMTETQEGQIQLICREYNGGNFAKLTTNLTGTNNDLIYTSKHANEDANDITVSYVDPGQASQSLNISVTDTDITVNLGTDGSGDISSTANDIITAIEADEDASTLVSVSLTDGSDGTGIVTATSIMSLTGGTSGIYTDTLGSVAPSVNTVINNQQTLPNSSATKVVAANNSLNKGGADFVVPDDATNAQDTINDAIEAMPLSAEVSCSVASVILYNQVPTMTSNTAPSGTASVSSVNTYIGTSDIIPTMTSNTTPSGVVSASSEFDNARKAWNAMDKTNATYWLTNTTTGWLQYQLTSAYIIVKYTITGDPVGTTRSPKNWTLQGSDDGVNWITLDTQINQTSWTLSEKRTFTFSNLTAYVYYKINVTLNNGGGYVGITEWELFEQVSYDAWRALNHTNTDQYDCWKANATTGYLEYQFTSAKTLVNYAISSINSSDQTLSPTSWTLKGSNNGTDWTTLDTQTDITDWTQAETKVFSFANDTDYLYYKLDITENNGHANYVAVGELSLGQADSFSMTSDSSSLNVNDDIYNGCNIKFTSGTQEGQTGLITDYTGSTKLIKIENFTGDSLPAIDDVFDIMGYTGKIVLMEGNYECDDSIILKSGITLEGQGAGTILKIKDGLNSDIDLIVNSDTTYGNFNCKLSNLSLNGNILNNTSGTQNAVNFDLVKNSNFDKVFIINFRNLGILLDNCSSITVDSCNITNNDTGIKLVNSDYNIINSSISDYNTNNGIYIDADSTNNSVSNSHFSYNEADSGILNYGSNNNFIGNICNNNYKYGISNQAASNNKISTNTCNNNNQHGIYIYNGSNSNDVAGNTCIGNGTTTDNTYSNIILDTNCNYNNIQNNTLRSTASSPKPKYGINISNSTCDKNIVCNNDFIDSNAYGTGSLNNAGTGTITASGNRTTS